jgi:hypothetical protein
MAFTPVFDDLQVGVSVGILDSDEHGARCPPTDITKRVGNFEALFCYFVLFVALYFRLGLIKICKKPVTSRVVHFF